MVSISESQRYQISLEATFEAMHTVAIHNWRVISKKYSDSSLRDS
jgi:hypothetical protein